MYAVSYSRTEAGIRARNAAAIQQERLLRQRELYKAAVEPPAPLCVVKKRVRPHTYRGIEDRACKLFKVTKTEIHSKRKHKEIAFVRQFIAYWACRLTTCSLPMIGRLMGGRDHTTVLWNKQTYPKKRAKMGRHLRELS